MKVVLFVDYSDALGGLLSWTSDIFEDAEDVELQIVGVVTDDSRTTWATSIDADAPAPLRPVHRDEVTSVAGAASLDQLPEKLHNIISTAGVYVPNCYETGYRLGVLARRLGLASTIVTFTHTDEPHYYYLAERYAPLVSKFLAADSRSYDGMLARLPHRRGDIVKTPHGLRAPAEIDRPHHPELRLLYAGRVVQRQKRVFDLITLAQELRRREVRFRWDIIGDGEDRAEFERAAARLAPEISCLGSMRRQEVLSRYQAYDCFVVSSSFDGMSIALMEAMASGLVPVVTNVGGVPDLITDGVEGFMWPVGKVSAAAERLYELWKNPARLRGCSHAARQRILSAHDPARRRARLVAVLRVAARYPVGSKADAERLLASGLRSPYFPES
jgi:glycosyltransferase involved in cell wall biosynthesis